MTSYCVVKFTDESVARIAPTCLVKLADKKPFVPIAAKDLPDAMVKVKWHKSMANGSSFDGYFDADVLAIAGSVKTAQAKAAELKVKLHSNPLISIPAAPDSSSESPQKSRKCKGSKGTDQGQKKGEKQEGTLPNDEAGLKKKVGELVQKEVTPKSPKKRSSSGSADKGQKKGEKQEGMLSNDEAELKKKPGKLLKEQVMAKSPKKRSSSGSAEKGTDRSLKKKLKMDKFVIQRCSSQAKLAVKTNPLLQFRDEIYMDSNQSDDDEVSLPNHPEKLQMESATTNHSDDDKSSDILENLQIKCEQDSKISDEDCSGDDLHNDFKDSRKILTSQVKPVSKVVEILDDTIPIDGLDNEIKDMDSESSSSDSEELSSGSSGEDEVAKLSAAKDGLEQELRLLKVQVADSKRNLTLTNNIRIAQRDELKKVKVELQMKNELIKTLQERNSTLQDMLCKTFTGLKFKKVVKDEPVTKELEEVPKCASTPKKIEAIDDSLDWTETQTLNFSSPSPIKSPGGTQGCDSKKKKKRKDKDDSNVIGEVCEKVLKHLQGSSPLKPDAKGYVHLGSNVLVDKHALEKLLKDHKGDVQKVAKGMAALTWTTSQREKRSLEGTKCNRFPNAPLKEPATPHKVNACLGVVKAHLLHQGERDGPGLAQNLKMGRKAIGAKFAQDYAQAKKRETDENQQF